MEKKDSRVQVFKLEKNSGVATARNYGFSQARGQWIAVLDSDDWFEAGRIEKLLSAALEKNVEMAADNQYLFDIKANMVAGTAFVSKEKEQIVDLDIFLQNSNATRHFDYGMLKALFKTEYIRKNSIEYLPSARLGEDYYMLLCCFVAGGRMVLLSEPLYYYVQPFGSISKKPQKKGRSHYNHELQKATNDYFIEKLQGKLSGSGIEQLRRRGNEIDAMICFYKLKDSVSRKDVTLMLRTLSKTNLSFWKMIIDKLRNILR